MMPDTPRPAETRARLALITGASSGLGEEYARQLAAAGTSLILAARRKDRLDALAGELRTAYPIECTVYPIDLADRVQRASLCAYIRSLPALDLLINNAGFGTTGSFASLDLAHHTTMLHVHLDAAIELTHAALPGMRARKIGGIINVASVAAFFAIPGGSIYCATKAALVSFSEVLALELRGSRIQVQALCPGYTYTGFHDTNMFTGFERSQLPGILWSPAGPVVRQSLNDLEKNRVVVIPGWINRFLAFFGRNKVFDIFVQPFIRLLFSNTV